ncbi:MAG: hypothetical protein NZ823_07200 [Blastocatellia bacterium]|nr:hypothetical protein [Blastocatellia bacterium]
MKPVIRLDRFGMESSTRTVLVEAEASPESAAVAERFYSLAEEWRRECAHLSSMREMVLHPAYQQIIGMGKEALPFLLRELERKPDHWDWALWAITGENPVPPEHAGRIADIAHDWLEWARRRGIEW